MSNLLFVKCPYCSNATAFEWGFEEYRPKILLCDPMEGGCDKFFAVFVKVEFDTKARKIEAEEGQI